MFETTGERSVFISRNRKIPRVCSGLIKPRHISSRRSCVVSKVKPRESLEDNYAGGRGGCVLEYTAVIKKKKKQLSFWNPRILRRAEELYFCFAWLFRFYITCGNAKYFLARTKNARCVNVVVRFRVKKFARKPTGILPRQERRDKITRVSI